MSTNCLAIKTRHPMVPGRSRILQRDRQRHSFKSILSHNHLLGWKNTYQSSIKLEWTDMNGWYSPHTEILIGLSIINQPFWSILGHPQRKSRTNCKTSWRNATSMGFSNDWVYWATPRTHWRGHIPFSIDYYELIKFTMEYPFLKFVGNHSEKIS